MPAYDINSIEGDSVAKGLSAKEYFFVNLSRCLSEFVGTVILTYFFYVVRSESQYLLFPYWFVTLFACDISGAHFNPAVTLA